MRLRYFFISRLTLILSICCFAIGIGVLSLSYVFNIGQWPLGFAFLLAPIGAFILAQTGFTQPDQIRPIVDPRFATTAYLLLLTLGIVTAFQTQYSRPTIHFIAISAAIALISIDLSRPASTRRDAIALSKILAAGIVFRAGRWFQYENIPGKDINDHYALAMQIAAGGKVPLSSEFASRYVDAPLLHLTIAISKITSQLEYKSVLFLTIIFPFTLGTVLATYAIIRRLNFGSNAAVFAAVFVCIGDMFLVRGLTSMTPSVLVILYSILVFFLFSTVLKNKTIILIIFVISSIFSHQLSAIGLLFMIFFFTAGARLYVWLNPEWKRRSSPLEQWLLLWIAVALLFILWQSISYTGGERTFLEAGVMRVYYTIVSVGADASSGVGGYEGGSHTFLSDLLYQLGYGLILFVGLVGLIRAMDTEYLSERRFALAVTGIGLFTLLYPLTFLGLNLLIIPHRLLVFLQFIAAVFGGFAVAQLYHSEIPKRRIITSGLLLLIVFSALTTPYLNQNDPVYNDERVYQTGVTDAELETILWAVDNSNTVYIDPVLDERMVMLEHQRRGHGLPSTNIYYYPTNMTYRSDAAIVSRQSIVTRDQIPTRDTFGVGSVVEGETLSESFHNSSKIYTTGNSSIHRSK